MFLLHQITWFERINWIELELELAVLGNCDVRISFTFVVIVMSVHNSLLLRWLWCQVSVDQSRWNHSYLKKKKKKKTVVIFTSKKKHLPKINYLLFIYSVNIPNCIPKIFWQKQYFRSTLNWIIDKGVSKYRNSITRTWIWKTTWVTDRL